MTEIDKEVTEKVIVVKNEVLGSEIPVSEEQLKLLMADYRSRHPEQFYGTREWGIKVTAENAEQVFEETGVLFKTF